jgi:hypothetical protein
LENDEDDEPDKGLKEILEPKVIESVAPHKEEEVDKEEKQMKEKVYSTRSKGYSSPS